MQVTGRLWFIWDGHGELIQFPTKTRGPTTFPMRLGSTYISLQVVGGKYQGRLVLAYAIRISLLI